MKFNIRSILGILILGVGLGLGIWIYLRDRPLELSPEDLIESTLLNEIQKSASSDSITKSVEKPKETETPLKGPALNQLKDEVQSDSHGTPPSLIIFAQTMAKKMIIAKSSSAKAKSFFPDLEKCVKEEEVTAVRGLCLQNAEDLAILYPELKNPFKKLRRAAPENVRSLPDYD
jgi:hypothetical protein